MGQRDFGTLSAPTGSGKTVMGLYLIAHRRQPTLIIVHTKDLALQWVERIQQFLKISNQDIGLIGGGKKQIGRLVTVALVQSFTNALMKSANISDIWWSMSATEPQVEPSPMPSLNSMPSICLACQRPPGEEITCPNSYFGI